jgi:DNA-binding winged helix-turn-helix (wHTH) protein
VSRRARLTPQTLRLLVVLTEAPAIVVSRERLRAALWADDTHIDFDRSLNSSIRKLRRRCDEADRPRYVQTLPGRGYRFIAPVERDAHFISGEDDLVTTAVSHVFVRDQRRIGSRRRSRSRTSVSSRSERARLGTMVRIPSGIDGFYGCKLLNRNGRG